MLSLTGGAYTAARILFFREPITGHGVPCPYKVQIQKLLRLLGVGC
jgi:hypothetical protein